MTMYEDYQEKISQLSSQLEEHQNNAGSAYYYGTVHAEDVMKLKSQLQDQERDYTDL